MREAGENLGRDAGDGKRRFKNGNPCPWNKELVCWGYRENGPWWVNWSQYDKMCKRHKIKPKTKKDFFKPMEHPNLLQKQYMIKFWNYFLDIKSKKGGNPVKKRVLQINQEIGVKTKDIRLNKLKEYAEIVIPYTMQSSISKRRNQFNKKKDNLHSPDHPRNRRCFVCLGQAECRHHIIALQNGGINSRMNLVSLCNACHAEIHPWLKNNN